jgi:hypothetical protein
MYHGSLLIMSLQVDRPVALATPGPLLVLRVDRGGLSKGLADFLPKILWLLLNKF